MRPFDACLKTESDWFGYLTVDNYKDVAERIRRMLTGKRYTFVAMNHAFTTEVQPPRLEARAGQRMKRARYNEPGSEITIHDEGELGLYGFTVSDTYGIWGVSTDKTDQSPVYLDSNPSGKPIGDYHAALWTAYISIEGMRQIRIVQRAPAGHRIEWIIAVDTNLDWDIANPCS